MASSLFFFSSPPRQPTDHWQSHSASTFFTPQQPSKQYRLNNAFAPPSPSPLRTSRNVNLMSSPPQYGGNIFQKPQEASEHDNENRWDVRRESLTPTTTLSSTEPLPQSDISDSDTFGTGVLSTPSAIFTKPTADASSATTTTTTSPFSLNIHTPTTQDTQSTNTNGNPTLFQFAARARSSSPSTLLQTHAKDNRDSRKRLFLDRLRSKRDDARSERTGEQVLRMDFLKERRRWEAEKARIDFGDDGMLDVDVDDESVNMDGDELSPTEDKEVQELAEQFLMAERERQRGEESQMQDPGYVDHAFEEFSDDGYDEAFMEVLSQDVSGREPQGHNPVDGGFGGRFQVPSQSQGLVDSEMDMS